MKAKIRILTRRIKRSYKKRQGTVDQGRDFDSDPAGDRNFLQAAVHVGRKR